MGTSLLKAAINRQLDDGAKSITRALLVAAGGGDWTKIKTALAEWEGKGYLRILKDPEFAKDEDVCIEMLKYIDRVGPAPNWP